MTQRRINKGREAEGTYTKKVSKKTKKEEDKSWTKSLPFPFTLSFPNNEGIVTIKMHEHISLSDLVTVETEKSASFLKFQMFSFPVYSQENILPPKKGVLMIIVAALCM